MSAAGLDQDGSSRKLDGDGRAPGQTRRSFVIFVIERRAGLWRFAAVRNTNVLPPPG
jgi:hypothetical protein